MKRKRKKSKPAPRLLPSVVVDYWRCNEELPGLWDDMSHLAGAKADGEIWWPDYCPIPCAAGYTALYTRSNPEIAAQMAAGLGAELTAAYAWDMERVVYRFDPSLSKALIAQAVDMADTDVLPTALLFQLPHRCFFVEVPLDDFDGFFAWIEYDISRGAPELRMQGLRMRGGQNFVTAPLVLHLVDGTLRDCILDTNEETKKHLITPAMLPQTADEIQPLLQMLQFVLYLLAANTETRPATDGAILVGKVTGQSLRADPKAHIRRAHWHHYWVGSERRGDRHLELRWIPPVQVGGAAPAPKVINIKEGKHGAS